MNSEKRKPLRTLDAFLIIAVLLLLLSMIGQDFIRYWTMREKGKDTVIVNFAVTDLTQEEGQALLSAFSESEAGELTFSTLDGMTATVTELKRSDEEGKTSELIGTFTAKGRKKSEEITVLHYGAIENGETMLVYHEKKGYFLEIITVSSEQN